MDTTYSFGAAIVIAAAALTLTGYDRVTFEDAPQPAPQVAPAPVSVTAAAIRLDPPPNALVCQERTAELRVASGAPVEDFLDEFFLVSDPRETCRKDGLAAEGGYDPDTGRCYTLRTPGTGEPDLPLVCTEVFRQGPDGVQVGEMRCKGWNRNIEAAVGGAFSLTMAGGDAALPARISQGDCRPL